MPAVKDLLQGKWLGHPLHPALVHVPVGLWPAALVFDLLSISGFGGNVFVRASFYCILGGLIVAVPAMAAGVADWWDIKPDKPAWKIGIYHMIANAVATAVWLVNLLLRLRLRDSAGGASELLLLLSVVGACILVFSGYLGGRMVYGHGIGIARHSKRRWREIARHGGARVPPLKE